MVVAFLFHKILRNLVCTKHFLLEMITQMENMCFNTIVGYTLRSLLDFHTTEKHIIHQLSIGHFICMCSKCIVFLPVIVMAMLR